MSENTTRSLESIEDEIRAVKEYIESYKTKLRESEEIRRKIKSRDFIAANEITMADVECVLGHEGGHRETTSMTIPVDPEMRGANSRDRQPE